ncbi:LOG family protein [Terriglobus tenax]|uniref:LOG family protein n=1 Tax=Terriglobus tenax TaxID=1111115 RepID=UPI0021E04D26|nr:TIGR00730 family Rossman fold protein [Terriglobus tenax]
MSSPTAISPSRNICVFCASADGTQPEYRLVAEDLGRKLASQNIGLIYGGARVGLMGAVADATLGSGGRVTGVIPHVLVDMEVAHHDVTELHIVKTMHDRKALMGEKADAFLILPGGFGTLEELFEVLAWSTLKLHAKPIVLLNTAKFWDGMLTFLDHCITEGVLTQPKRDLLLVADTVDEAIRLCVG